MKALVTQSCLTLCDPMDCSLPGSSVHAIFQARILEWLAISFSRGLQSDFLPAELPGKPIITWEAQNHLEGLLDTPLGLILRTSEMRLRTGISIKLPGDDNSAGLGTIFLGFLI